MSDAKTAKASADLGAMAVQLLTQLQANQNVEEKFKDVKVRREGTMIILPDGMSYREARVWLQRQEEAEEKNVAVHCSIPCFPLDGVIALRRALEERYGFTAYTDTPDPFFGPQPPVMVQVTLFDGSLETAPIGRIQPPMLEGGYLNASCGKMTVEVSGEVKKKFESEVQAVLARTKELLVARSIYRGTAVILNLDWIRDDEKFHPEKHAPLFMDVTDVDENGLILNKVTMQSLTCNIFTLLEETEACRQNGIPLKHGCLMAGDFGTGKTLTARVTASKAVRNGWTFIYLKTPEEVALALKMAEMYAPAVLFTEDIDEVVGGERDEEINRILNTIDGVDTKDKPIITILTTNNVKTINPAFLRPGRMDTVVHFESPDKEAAVKFVQLYGRDDDGHSLVTQLTDDEKEAIGNALTGYVPAFIAEAMQKAKRFAINEFGINILGKVNASHILAAADVLRSHKKLMERPEQMSPEEEVCNAQRIIFQDGIVNREKAKMLRRDAE